MDKVLARASVTIEVVEDMDNYEAQVISTNGSILQPYDTSTTLIGTVLKNKVDITNSITNVKWTKWNPSKDNLIECPEWNERHKGESTIQISKDDVDSKSIFMFEAYNNRDELLCSSSISIIDVNDLLVSTKEPTNPYVGQLWIDDTKEPATIYVWNGYKWVVSGTVGAIAKNLLRNTNFFIDCKYWDVVGDTRDMYTPTPYEYLSHRFAKLNSNVMTDHTRGITQTTTDIINKNNEYSFQMLFYSKTDDETFSNKIRINIYSVEANGDETVLYTNELEAIKKIQQLYARFKTTDYTEAIRVEILGENTWRFNFSIAELALYNTWNNYPWTVNPIDMNITNYTQEDLWNILSNNGTVQGIFSQTNPATGQLDYYINASLITAGKLLAQYMDLYNLKVLRKDNPELPPTLEIDEKGEVIVRSDKILLSSGESLLDSVNKATFEMAQDIIRLKVESNGKQTLFTMNEDDIIIKAENISLFGYTTINDYFIIHEDGTLEANDAKFNGTIIGSTIKSEDSDNPAFSLTADGTITGSTIKGSTVEGAIVKGGTLIAPEIYSEEIYDKDGNPLLDDMGLPIVPKFSLTKEGILTANEAEIRGRVSGAILEGTELMTSGGNFHVDTKGKLYAKEAEFVGSITSGGEIHGAELIGGTIRNEDSSFTVSSEGDVTGAKIFGGQIGIGRIDEDNLYGAFTVDTDGNCNITKGKITIGDNFSVSNAGNLVANDAKFTGNINVDGIIKGNTILVAPKIQSGDVFESSDFSVDEFGNVKGANLYGGSLSIGKINGTDNYNFTVDEFGNMIAKSGKFTGDILSGSKITGASIQSVNGNFSISEAGAINGGSINIKDKFIVTPDGKMEAIEAKFSGEIKCGDNFSVTNDGFVTATGVDLTGTITATEGKIAGYEISGGKLIGSAVGMNANKTTGDESIAFWAGSNTPEKASFKVSHTGVLTATNAKITGTISGSDIEGSSIIGSSIKIGPVDTDSDDTVDYYNFTVSSEGHMEIGGKGVQVIDDYNRSPLEITNSGRIYSASSTAGQYTRISAGKIICHGLDSDNKDITTAIGQGNIECAGSLGTTSIVQGQISATSGKFSGTISGSGITASTFNSEYNLFRVLDDGSVETTDLTASGIISATVLAGDELNVPLYAPALTEDFTVYIDENKTSASSLYDEADDGKVYFKTVADLLGVCPRNLNGHNLIINLETEVTDNISISGLNNGFVIMNMNGKTIKGYLYVKGAGLYFNLYGVKSGTTGSSQTNAKIIPNKGYLTYETSDAPRYFCMYIYVARARVHNVDFYKDNSDGNDYGICADGGTSLVAKDIRAINKPYSLVRVIDNSSAFLERTSGDTSATPIQAIDGSIIHLADGNHAYGNAGGTKRVFTNNGSQIFYDSNAVTFKKETVTDTSSTNTNTSTGTTTTKTVAIKSTTGLSYRTDGSVSPWSTDKIVRQGRWSSSLGKNTGYWFFGSEIYNILKNNSASNITSIKIKITRQSGGSSAAIKHYLRAHTYTSKPSSTPSLIGTSTLNKSFDLTVGSSTTISLTASEISALKSAGAKGFGIYTSNMTTGASGSYSCCSPSCTVTITYKS